MNNNILLFFQIDTAAKRDEAENKIEVFFKSSSDQRLR
jgi:hypothetical protein